MPQRIKAVLKVKGCPSKSHLPNKAAGKWKFCLSLLLYKNALFKYDFFFQETELFQFVTPFKNLVDFGKDDCIKDFFHILSVTFFSSSRNLQSEVGSQRSCLMADSSQLAPLHILLDGSFFLLAESFILVLWYWGLHKDMHAVYLRICQCVDDCDENSYSLQLYI